jgi:hypothetical protein
MTTITTDIRKSGIDVIGNIAWGTHFRFVLSAASAAAS